jgi:hypothetical protein
MRVPNKQEFKTEYTIKFFKRHDLSKQNSVLVDPSRNVVMDMMIVDPLIFDKIKVCFNEDEVKDSAFLSGDANQLVPSETLLSGTEKALVKDDNIKSMKLRDAIDVHVFFEKIIDEEDCVIGFISQVKSGDDGLLLPGSIVLNYTIT